MLDEHRSGGSSRHLRIATDQLAEQQPGTGRPTDAVQASGIVMLRSGVDSRAAI
jgi:hypothetical protein